MFQYKQIFFFVNFLNSILIKRSLLFFIIIIIIIYYYLLLFFIFNAIKKTKNKIKEAFTLYI